MVVYKGFGHGITKPKAMRAVMRHNLEWFNHYIFGDPLPDLSALPLSEERRAGGEEVAYRKLQAVSDQPSALF